MPFIIGPDPQNQIYGLINLILNSWVGLQAGIQYAGDAGFITSTPACIRILALPDEDNLLISIQNHFCHCTI